jgi:hypothetical protein
MKEGALHERSTGLLAGMLIQHTILAPASARKVLTAANPGRSAQRSAPAAVPRP